MRIFVSLVKVKSEIHFNKKVLGCNGKFRELDAMCKFRVIASVVFNFSEAILIKMASSLKNAPRHDTKLKNLHIT